MLTFFAPESNEWMDERRQRKMKGWKHRKDQEAEGDCHAPTPPRSRLNQKEASFGPFLSENESEKRQGGRG